MKSNRSLFAFLLTVIFLMLPAARGTASAAPDSESGDAGRYGDGDKARNTPAWKPEELEGLLAPVALYPDPLLAQVLVAATYPLEVVEARQWLKNHPTLQGKALTEAAAGEDWEASVQALVAFPDVLDRLTENVRWTTDLGNAFLDQEKDVMAAVQRLRREAQESGKLKSSREQNVTTRVVETERVVEIVPADPNVIYVPAYNPLLIWGEPGYYGYPSLRYPSRFSSADLWVGFGVGVTLGALFTDWDSWYCGFPGWGWGWGWPYWSWGGSYCWNWGYGWGWGCGWNSWGWGCGWGRHAGVYCNGGFHHRYGYHQQHYGHGQRGQWQHNAYHRGDVPYHSRDAARRYGGANGRSAYSRNMVRSDARAVYGRDGSRGASLGDRPAYARGMAGSSRSTYSRGTSESSRPTYSRGTSESSRSTYSRGTSESSRSTYGERSTYSRGASGSSRPAYGDRPKYSGGDRSLGSRGGAYGSRSFAGSRNDSGTRASYGDRSSGYRSSYGSRPDYGSRSFSGGSSFGGRAFSGGSAYGSRSGGGSFRGGSSFGSFSGGRSYGGSSGGRSFGGGSFSGGRSGGGSFSGGRSGGSHR